MNRQASATRLGPVSRVLLVLAAVALAAAGCRTSGDDTSSSTTTTEAPKDGGALVMAVDQETDGWNPAISQWTNAGWWVGSSVIEPLATYDEHGETVMWLAESIEPAQPGRFDSWRITVKPDIRFHNGEVLDAGALQANLELLTNGKSLSGIALNGRITSIDPVDDRTVQVNLTTAWADFPALLTGSPGMMMAREMIDEPLGGLAEPIGTGPFVFDSWEPHESFKAHRNPDYWRPGEPHLDSIEFRPIVDNKQAVAALQRGDVDMIVTTKAQDIDLAGPGNQVITDFASEKTVLIANTAQHPERPTNPLMNRHARLALAHATDTAAVRAMVSGGQELSTSTQPMVAGTSWAVPDDETGYVAHDLDKARQELAEYQRETGASTLTFELATTEAQDDLAIANALADQWKAIGIDARVQAKTTLSMVADSVYGNFDVIIQRNYGYPNPDTDLIFFTSAGAKPPGALSVNFSRFTDPAIDAAATTIQSTDDRAVQRDGYRTITRVVNASASNLWLYDTPFAIIASPTVKGTESLTTHRFGNALPKPWLWGSVWRQ